MKPHVNLAIDGPLATMTFSNVERRNAMTVDMWQQIPGVCSQIVAEVGVRVVVLKGHGTEAFVAGADISEFEQHRLGEKAARYDDTVARATDAIAELPMPVVALIHGFCIGGGLALALSADIRYSTIDSVFGLPPARLGLGYPPRGLAKLVDQIGPAATKELLFTADWIDASVALRWGLVNATVASGELDEFVAQKVATIASRAPLTQAAAKLAITDYLDHGHQAPTDRAIAATRRCVVSEDYAEGVAAFLDKRRPKFLGR